MQPLTKTYQESFYNNNTLYSSITINGQSLDDTTFDSIDTIQYGTTTVYSNSAWTSGYDSTLLYSPRMSQPSISSINSDESIVTFTTQEINDDILIEYGGSIIGEFTAPKEFSLTTGYTVGDGDIVITTNSNVSRVVASYGGSDIIDDSNGNSIYTIQCNGEYMETDIVITIT